MKNNLIARYYQDFKSELQDIYPGLKEDYLLSCFEQSGLAFEDFILKVKNQMALEYIVGEAFFYNHSFYVNPSVLIPRCETEILVEHALKFISTLSKDEISIADMGTGSGNILLSIACDTAKKIKAYAIDISKEALQIAQKNYERISPANCKIQFVESDRLWGFKESLDLIVSNPPYIKRNEDFSKVHKTVLNNEPHLALFLNDDSYEEWFEEFFSQVFLRLNKGGMFLMEGHEDHLDNLKDMARRASLAQVEILKDYNNRNRFLRAIKE